MKPSRNRHHRRSVRELIRDLILEVGIAVLLVVVVLYSALHSPRHAFAARWIPWLGLAAMTAVIFGYALRDLRRYWRRHLFWEMWLLLLLVHLGGYAEVLLHTEHFGTLWFAIMAPFEIVVIYPLLELAGSQSETARHSSDSSAV